jgi:large subunit ribosomal protein L23
MASTIADARDVIIAPVISEKSYSVMPEGHYTFRVHPDAHKTQIRQAVEEIWGVNVVSVRTSTVRPKPFRSRRGRAFGYHPGWKKAVVRLAEGETIGLFEGMGL